MTYSLDYPSITIDWLPNIDTEEKLDYTVQRCLIGTQATGNNDNMIMIVKLRIPLMNEIKNKNYIAQMELDD